jgi:hypothetical protein
VGSAFSYNITASNSPTSYNATGLPAGLSVSTSSGAITGTPTASGTSSVTISAINAYGTGTATLTLAVAPAGSGPSFANASFETPSVGGGFTYSSTGASWTFTNNAGITGTGGAYGCPAAVNGSQVGLLQGTPAAGFGSMSQSVSFTSGTYTISFYAAQRYGNQVQPIQVTVDSTVVGTYTPASGGNFAQITTAPFTVAAGSHTVTFAATVDSSDLTTFVDVMSIEY